MTAVNRPQLTGSRCQCAGCGQLFNSTSTFDRHRVGAYAKPGRLTGDRRCLFVPELIAKGWGRNKAGYWIERARETATARAGVHNSTPPATCVPEMTRNGPNARWARE